MTARTVPNIWHIWLKSLHYTTPAVWSKELSVTGWLDHVPVHVYDSYLIIPSILKHLQGMCLHLFLCMVSQFHCYLAGDKVLAECWKPIFLFTLSSVSQLKGTKHVSNQTLTLVSQWHWYDFVNQNTCACRLEWAVPTFYALTTLNIKTWYKQRKWKAIGKTVKAMK